MSHSEEGENYWPGYVDALTSMVQVLAFVMMMLAMAVFVLSQSVAKHAVEAIAKAVNADTKPNASVKELTQAVMDRLQQIPRVAPAIDPTKLSSSAPSGQTASADGASDPKPEKLIGLRLNGPQNRKEDVVQAPPNAPHLVVDFAERSFTIEQERERSLSAFVETNKVVEQGQTLLINAYAYSGDGALSEARRLAYYRAMTTRKQLIDAKVRPENIRVNVNDTADKDKGSTVETAIAGSGVH